MTIAELTRQATEAEAEAVKATKELAERAKQELGTLLTGHKPRSLKTRARRKPKADIPSYEGLEGEWLDWLEVAQTYEGKIPAQDRDDWRHDCMLELERATKRDGKPLPILRAYRIASLMVALYYRNLNRYSTRVCVYNGYPTVLHCKACLNKTEGKRCVWLATRPVERLDSEIIDDEGYAVKLLDTVADDHAIDLDAWLDAKAWLLGCKTRLVQIAYKRRNGILLDGKDQDYLDHWRKKNDQLKLAVF